MARKTGHGQGGGASPAEHGQGRHSVAGGDRQEFWESACGTGRMETGAVEEVSGKGLERETAFSSRRAAVCPDRYVASEHHLGGSDKTNQACWEYVEATR